MIISYYKMTGDELSRIFFEAKKKNKKLTKDAFADRIGVGRTKLFDIFKGVPLDEDDAKEIENKIKADAELNSARTLIHVPDKSTDVAPDRASIPYGGPGLELLAKSMEMINETLKMVKDSLTIISDDNKFIKEDAEIYRSIVKEGMNRGAIKFVEPKR